jgi:ketosteroid isomerase-like protein
MTVDRLEAALAANEAFYDAFRLRDMTVMAALWAERHPCVCIHPGWAPITGRNAVLASWRGILGHAGAPAISQHRAEASALGGDLVAVVCHERIGRGWLAATNLFATEDGVWRILFHQASPMAPPDDDP